MSADGPLRGVKVLDLSALGPGPFATMMLGDFGAEVLAIQRRDPPAFDPSVGLARGKSRVGLDLRSTDGEQAVRGLAERCDVLVEGFRPGVMERLGLGPGHLLALNPRLVYGRLTGWGQQGPYAERAGHDINYLAISGALGLTGAGHPVAPPALLGDLANGAYLLVLGVVLALMERQRTGRGQVVDAAITDGATYILSALLGERQYGLWDGDPAHHMLSGRAPFYGVYACADGRWFSVGAIETRFYGAMLDALGLHDVDRSPAAQMNLDNWPMLRRRIAAVFRTRTREAWTKVFADADACGAPVIELEEIPSEPHLVARGVAFEDSRGVRIAPAPRLSAYPGLGADGASPRQAAADVLAAWGLPASLCKALVEKGAAWSA